MFVSLLGVGLGVVDAADTGSEEVGGGQVPNGVVGRRLGVDQVGDPVLGVRMIRLVNLDLKFAMVRARNCRKARALQTFREPTEPGEQVDGGQFVVGEAALAGRGAVFGRGPHRVTAARSSPLRASKSSVSSVKESTVMSIDAEASASTTAVC